MKNKPQRKPAIFLTWLPLALMWLMMAVEQPAVAAVIARKTEAVQQLAAFGLAFSLALFIEGPVVQMLAAGTALISNRQNYQRILTLMHVIGISATLIQGMLCLPFVFNPFARIVMGIPEVLIRPTRLTLIAMLPWTIGVGYRRLWQGALIRYGKTAVIPITMIIRLLASSGVLYWGIFREAVPGAVLGGLALSVGVMAGAVAAGIYVRPVIKNLPEADRGQLNSDVISWKDLMSFYLPLALTSFINLGSRPIVQMGMTRGLMALESLAIWPVLIGYTFLFTAMSLSFQEVVIARLDDAETKKRLMRFTLFLALTLVALYMVILATLLWRYWFMGVSGLSEELTFLSRAALIFCFPMIFLSAFISLFRGALIRSRRTREVTFAVALKVFTMLASLMIGVQFLPYPAITVIAISYSLAFSAEFIYLASRRALRRL